MSNKIAFDALWDESPIDVTPEVNFIWSIANKLRGSYMPDKYGDVIIPMTILRRLECALEPTKKAVTDMFAKNPNYPPKAMCRISGYQFYNTSPYTLKELCNEPDNIKSNFKVYIQGFSAEVQEIFNGLEMFSHIDKMDKDGCLFSVVQAFADLDLDPNTYDSIKMGYIFEHLIGKFYQNVDAGQFYTGRDIIKCLVAVLISEGCDDIFDDGKVVTVCDQACGTDGMLSTAYSFIKHYNPSADVRLFGQEFMPQSYAVGLAEVMIKGQNIENFRNADTFKEDCFPNIKMRFVLENPPFGTPWAGKDAKAGQEDAVRNEFKRGKKGRWGAGLPSGGDSQLIFMQSAIDKMDDKVGRAAIIENNSPLFTGGTASGESQHGIITSAYTTIKANRELVPEFFQYLLHSYDAMKVLYNMGSGVRQGLNFSELSKMPLISPDMLEQKKIADFLDAKCSEIDAISADIQKEIKTLEQYKRSVITEAVTKGLNPDAEMKDSGVPWIGKMPANWTCIKGKYILKYMQKPVKTDDGVITCFRDGEVTLRSNRREDGFTMADKEIGYQGIDAGDLVVHGMDGFAGAIGISDSRGKASPVLNVLDSWQNKKYIMYYLRSMAYGDVFAALATGIRVRSCDLRWNKLSVLFYPVPPLEEQAEIVQYIEDTLNKVNGVISEKKQQLTVIDSYKKSLIYEYVTGKKEAL